MLRIIREEEPQKPSTRLSTAEGLPNIAASRGSEPKKLSGLVKGELDWVVMKALEKDRNRRYDTANNLAADVERYLHNETVAGLLRRRQCIDSASSSAGTSSELRQAQRLPSQCWWASPVRQAVCFGLCSERKAAQASAALATTQAARSDQVAAIPQRHAQRSRPQRSFGSRHHNAKGNRRSDGQSR